MTLSGIPDPKNGGQLTSPVYRCSYDLLGRLSRVEALEKNDVTIDVDPNTAGEQPETESYAYTLNGSLDYEVNPDGSVTDYTYDDLNRLTDIDEYRADTTTPDDFTDNPKLSEYSYTLRDDGKRDSADEIIYDTDGTTKLSHTQFDWTYDDAGRLTDEVFTDVGDLLDSLPSLEGEGQGEGVHDYHTSFEYDLTGNRLKKTTITDDDGTAGFDAATDTDEVVTYGQDVNDRMTSEDRVVDGAAVDSTAYGYTGTQQTSKTVTDAGSSFSRQTSSFQYDLQGRMSDVVSTTNDPSTGSMASQSWFTYAYGTDGIRIRATEYEAPLNTENWTLKTDTQYLIDSRNHTGYQQVLEETVYDVDPTTGAETESKKIVYTIGHDHISQTTFEPGGPTQGETLVFHRDGHGSTRILTDLAGVIATVGSAAQIYHYTAYGNAINFQMANAATQYLYSGEQFDARIGQQYLRARYYNQVNGTFNRLDPFFGNTTDPQSFHKYLYGHGDPVNNTDPTGLFALGSSLATAGSFALNVATVAGAISVAYKGFKDGWDTLTFWDWLGLLPVAGQIAKFKAIAKYTSATQRWTQFALAESRIATTIKNLSVSLTQVAGRARSSLAARIGTQVHNAFANSRFMNYMQRMATAVAGNSWIQIYPMGTPFPGMTGTGMFPDLAIVFPRIKFAIVVDLKPVPQSVFAQGIIQSMIHIENNDASARAERNAQETHFRTRGIKALYVYLPYASPLVP